MPVIVRSAVGAEQYLSLQIVPYGAGQLLVLVRDVTRQTRLEAMRKDFVANASHELRSPLTVISGYLETLAQEPELDPALGGPAAGHAAQAQRMTGIVQDLLELSRLESSDGEAPRRADRCGRADGAAAPGRAGARACIRPQVQVRADSNAHAAGRGAARSTRRSPTWWTTPRSTRRRRARCRCAGGPMRRAGYFSVTDTGIGIAAEHIPRLTERFYRVDAGRSRATGGSGLGLAIVKHVLQRHGAQLSIESEEGNGSTFTCHFPRERLQSAGVSGRRRGERDWQP